MMIETLQKKIQTGLSELNVTVNSKADETLQDYIFLLDKWNKAYNLTAVRDIEKMIPYHLLDSLSIHPFLRGDLILDVGTGAGLPGIPLAIVNPEKKFILLDSNGKKTRFVQHAIHQLQLNNVTVIQSRIEAYQPEQEITTIVSRAFSSIIDYYQAVKPLMTNQTQLLAMKGKAPIQEIDEIRTESVKIHSEILHVPDINAERCVVMIQGQECDKNNSNN